LDQNIFRQAAALLQPARSTGSVARGCLSAWDSEAGLLEGSSDESPESESEVLMTVVPDWTIVWGLALWVLIVFVQLLDSCEARTVDWETPRKIHELALRADDLKGVAQRVAVVVCYPAL
jgi:hypothetical protein